MKYKVFGIGSSKTGTTSLSHALKRHHFKIYPGSYTSANHLMPMIKDKNYKSFFEVINKFDCFDDVPFSHGEIYKILYKKYHNAKFILTVRDPDSWFKSLSHQLTFNRDKKMLPLQKCIECGWDGLHDHIKLTYGNISLHKDKKYIIKTYEKRNKEIQEFFKDKPGKLLVMDICCGDDKENMKLLKKFLGVESEFDAIPHFNIKVHLKNHLNLSKRKNR